jgi:hypothetical protein
VDEREHVSRVLDLDEPGTAGVAAIPQEEHCP